MSRPAKPIGKRARARIAKMRRDPAGRFSLEAARYLRTVGWAPLISGPIQVRGFGEGGLGHYELVVTFMGRRIEPSEASQKAARKRT